MSTATEIDPGGGRAEVRIHVPLTVDGQHAIEWRVGFTPYARAPRHTKRRPNLPGFQTDGGSYATGHSAQMDMHRAVTPDWGSSFH